MFLALYSPSLPSCRAACSYNCFDIAVPFGGYKSSGIGRDKGEYALECYTQVKAVYQALDEEQCWL